MYELVKKKKSLGAKIILFLVGCAIISEFLKVIFGTNLTIDETLMQTAQEANKHCPVIIDSTTRLDNVSALTGNRLLFNYTLIGVEAIPGMDTSAFKDGVKEMIINKIQTNPKYNQLRKDGVGFAATWYDEKSHYICGLVVDPADYK